jgi:ketosteroid isomerase-like protein
MGSGLGVDAVQRALDALITADHESAAERFSTDVVLTGAGGCLEGRATGLSAVLDRFADISARTGGTFGTEVEAVYTGSTSDVVVVTRHWARVDDEEIRGTQALVLTTEGGRIRTIEVLTGGGHATGIWD